MTFVFVNTYSTSATMLFLWALALGASFCAQCSAERAIIAVIVGTRPDVIKLAPVVNAFRSTGFRDIGVTLINSGQHKELLQPALDLFQLSPDVNLDLMRYSTNGSAVFVSRAIEAFSAALQQMTPLPRAVVVQGDTNTALAGAMAAFYLQIPVVHVEAGLRTWDISSPFPEEFNRRAISVIAALSLAPTDLAKDNLVKSGASLDTIKVTGNTVIDSVESIRDNPNLTEDYFSQFVQPQLIDERGVQKRFVIVTSHRRENIGQGLQSILLAVRVLAESHPNVIFLYIFHMNPLTRGPVREILHGIDNVIMTEPIEYPRFVRLLSDAALVVTDSGGLQEEAAYLGVRCIVLR
jgi:UDP-N-acetylglucosamine 2-epimerase (non-hydrolysing)